VVRAIEYARDTNGQLNDGRFTVSYTGNGLTFTDNTGSGAVTVEALNDSNAARDLGLLTPFSGNTLTTRDLVGGLNTVLLSSLNGGNGVETGQVQFDLRDGSSVSIDFSGDATLQQVIDRINEQGNLSAEVGPGGSGLVIRDLSTGTGVTTISDLTGQTAADLQIAGTSNDGEVFGGDLNLQYISENTLLEDLFGGQGLSLQGSDGRQVATFDIVTSNGESVAISLSSSTHQTVGDIIDEINSTFGDIEGLDVTARMNETGDGLEIIDNTGGEGRLTIADTSGSVAEKLGISGTAGTDNTLSGRLSGVIELEGSETLEDVVSTINKADVGVRASIINDGTPGAPYRLMITSQTTGSAGEIAFSSNLPGFQLSTLTEAQDASVTIGSPDSASPIIVTSSSNTINDIVDGVTLNLLGVSEGPVQVSVDSDVDSVVEDINSFVKSFNDTADRINELTDYNVETEEGGVLLGENAVLQLYNQMYSQINQTVGDTSLSFRRLSDVGISIEEGARLSFNEDEFREAFAADPDGVRKLFTYVRVDEDETGEETAVKVGIAAQMKDFVDGVTSTVDGTLTRQTQQIDQQIELYQDRISDLEDLLSRREQRLFEQFYAMERSLAELQAQQSSLSSLSSLASSAGGGVTANLASL
jgi:flagellar hook-associated protein 2